jgi:hypothetical protein
MYRFGAEVESGIIHDRRAPIMKLSTKPLSALFYRAYLRSRLQGCTRDLQTIASQRENDLHAERILNRQMCEMRTKLQSLQA